MVPALRTTMPREVYSEPKVRLEHDQEHRCFIMHWVSYNGPHYRKAIEALLAEVRKHGAKTYISDASKPTDVQSQEDLAWIATKMPEMAKNGVKRVIVVMPASNVAKMGSRRMGQTVTASGLERIEVASLEEALKLAKSS